MQVKPVCFFLPWHSVPVFERLFGFDDQNYILIRCNRFINWKIGSRSVIFGESQNSWSSETFDWLVQELFKLTPVLARHHDFMPYQELRIRELAFATMDLVHSLRVTNPSFVYFGFQSSHHIDSSMLELACRINEIPQIFEFPVPGNSVMLFQQLHGITTREVCDIFTSSQNYSESHFLYSSDKFIPENPDFNGSSPSFNLTQSVYWLVSRHILYSIKLVIKKFIFFNKNFRDFRVFDA